jgi:hypothetical protein
VVCCVFSKKRGLKPWIIIYTNKLEYCRNIRYFKCKGKICKNLKDDQSGEDVILCYIDTQGLKYKYQMGFETPVVYTLTNVYPISITVMFLTYVYIILS